MFNFWRILLTPKKFVKPCLHSSYTVQNSFQFDEFFHDFTNQKKIMKKFGKLCLHLSYIVQNSFLLDEIFHDFTNQKKIMKKFGKLCLHFSYKGKTPSILTRFSLLVQNSNLQTKLKLVF